MHGDLTTLAGFLIRLEEHSGEELVFVTGEKAIRPGYHVTELKSAAVHSIDCGRNETQRAETAVQLLDGSGSDGEERMTPAKFGNIAKFSISKIPELAGGDLFFEYAPENGPMLKWEVDAIAKRAGSVEVSLKEVKAACHPFQRWLEAQDEMQFEGSAASCCGQEKSQPAGRSCCG